MMLTLSDGSPLALAARSDALCRKCHCYRQMLMMVPPAVYLCHPL